MSIQENLGSAHIEQDVEIHPEQAAPFAQFRLHVEHVRDNGDMLDVTSGFERFSSKTENILLTAAVAHGMLVLGPTGPVQTAAISAGVYGYMQVRQGIKDKRLRSEINESGSLDIGERLGEHYELWKIPNEQTGESEVVMHWQGTSFAETKDEDLQPRTLPHCLNLITKLAADNDIKAIFISPQTLDDVPNAEAFATTRVDLLEWASKKKDTILTDQDNSHSHEVLVFDPLQLKVLAENLEKNEKIDPSTEKYIAILRTKNAEHPLVRAYDAHIDTQSLLPKKLQTVAKSCVERRLQDVAAIRSFDQDGMPTKSKIHLSGQLNGNESVKWHVAGKHFDTQRADAALDMSLVQAEEVLSEPDAYPSPYVVQAVERVIASGAVNMLSKKPNDEHRAHVIDKNIQFSLAHAQVAGKPIAYKHTAGESHVARPTRLRRYVAGIALLTMVGIGAGSYVLEEKANSTYNQAYTDNKKRVARHEHTIVDLLTDAQKAHAQRMTDKAHPLAGAYVGMREQEQAVVNAAIGAVKGFALRIKDGASATSEAASNVGLATGEAAVGNVTNPGDTTPIWHIKNPSNLDLTGYWATNVGDTLTEAGTWYTDPSSLDMYEQDLSTTVGTTENVVEVSGKTTLGISGNRAFISGVPVLEGTVIVAANYDGEPVIMRRDESGLQSFMLRHKSTADESFKSGHNFTYWLLPSPRAPKVVAVNLQERDRPDKLTRQSWHKVIPDLTELSGDERLQREVAYVRDHFVYDYQPIKNNQTKEMKSGSLIPGQFVFEQLKSGRANCNTAATTVVLDNPQADVAWGFFNDGSNTLDTNERHMWVVNGDGNRYDPTPVKSEIDVFASESDNASGKKIGPQDIGLTMLGLGALGGYLAARRRINRGVSRAALRRTSDEDVYRTLQVVNAALYAPSFKHPDTTSHNVPSKDETVAKLASPEYHTKETRTILSQLAADKQDSKVIRAAARILRHIGRTQPLNSPLATGDDVHAVL